MCSQYTVYVSPQDVRLAMLAPTGEEEDELDQFMEGLEHKSGIDNGQQLTAYKAYKLICIKPNTISFH